MKAPATKEEREALRILLDRAKDMDYEGFTEWEAEEFLPSLQEQTYWSQKQRDIFDAIWNKVMGDDDRSSASFRFRQ